MDLTPIKLRPILSIGLYGSTMTVTPFPLPRGTATKLLRSLANTDRVLLVPPRLAKGEWRHVTLLRQVHRCLEDGEIVDGPKTNELGYWQYLMRRVGAGQEIYMIATLFQGKDEHWRVAITEVTDEHE